MILDYPRWIITGVSVITLVMLVFVNQLKMNFSIEQLFALNDPAVDRYFEFLEEFEREDNLILLLYECDDPFSYHNLVLNQKLIQNFESIIGVNKVTSLSNLEIFTDGDDELLRPVYPYIPQSADSLQAAKHRILSSPLVKQTLISNDGSLASIAIELHDVFNNHDLREKIINEIDIMQNTVGWNWHQAGIPILRTRYVQLMVSDTIRFLIPVALMLSLIHI